MSDNIRAKDRLDADLLREAVQRLIDEEIRWRLKAILDEQDEEQAILLMLSEM